MYYRVALLSLVGLANKYFFILRPIAHDRTVAYYEGGWWRGVADGPLRNYSLTLAVAMHSPSPFITT